VTRIVFATQVVDPEDPNLGAVVGMIRALAQRVDEVVVLADRAVAGTLPDNCRVHAFGAGSKSGRGRRFVAGLSRELKPKPIAFVAHSVPLYAILAAPLVRPRGIPLLLWFTHWKRSRTLVLAERLSTTVLTVERRSFPLDSPKVVAIGHGIDTDVFACLEREPGSRLRAVALGRTSPAKGLETIARACEFAGVELEVYGPSITDEERAERDRLIGLGVGMRGPVPYSEVRELLASRDVLINNMREGALDKIVYEAAATCMPVLASNTGFDDVLPRELIFPRDDPTVLAARLRTLREMDRNALGHELRARVENRHSAGHWADGVIEAAQR
jgi:glycosyltransferase involved in cell wall biosynthesis